MIKLDRSPSSVVVVCDDCPWWFAFAFTYDDAERRACTHEENVHPDSTNMRDRAATRASMAKSRAAKRAAM